MSKEINVSLLLKVLKSAWWKILIITVVIAVAVAAFTNFLIPKKYAASTEFYVLNTSTTSEYTTTALLSAAEYLANDYIKIINSDTMINKVIERCKASEEVKALGYTDTDFTASSIRSLISSNTSSESSTFTITVTHTDPKLAHYVCSFIKEEAPAIIKEISRPSYKSSLYVYVGDSNSNGVRDADEFQTVSEEDLECVKTLRSPTGVSLVSPNVPTYTLISAMLAAVLSYVVFLVIKISNTVIKNTEDAEEMIDQTIIGNIPNWNTTADSEVKGDKNEKQ